MVKLAILNPGGGYFVFQNTPQNIVNDPDVINSFNISWNIYNRSTDVRFNTDPTNVASHDQQMFLDKRNGEYWLSTMSSYLDAAPWRDVVLGTVTDPGGGGGGGGTGLPIYRLLNASPTLNPTADITKPWDSGATYPGCSPANQAACMPVQFGTLALGVDYAYAHNEIPVRVGSAAEAWAIVAGTLAVNPNNILPPNPTPGPGGTPGTILGMDTTTLLLVGAGIFLLMSSGRSSS